MKNVALSALLALLSGVAPAATITITMLQSGSDVIVSYSGDVDIAGAIGTTSAIPAGPNFAFEVQPYVGQLTLVGSMANDNVNKLLLTSLGLDDGFGPGGSTVFAPYGTGTGEDPTTGYAFQVGAGWPQVSTNVTGNGGFGLVGGGSIALAIPSTYASGILSGTTTFHGTTLATLGADAGHYEYKLTKLSGADSFVNLDVVAVPEPAIAAAGVSAVVAGAFGRWAKRRRRRMHGLDEAGLRWKS